MRWQSIAGSACGVGMNDDDETNESEHAPLRLKLSVLRVEHQDLDAAVHALEAKPMPDQIQIARLKKKKLALRDAIAQLEDVLTPDIIA
jgi:hypothetical protein